MTNKWSVQTGNARQTCHHVNSNDWPQYLQLLIDERNAGRVVGWTSIPVTGGINVICTHRAERGFKC